MVVIKDDILEEYIAQEMKKLDYRDPSSFLMNHFREGICELKQNKKIYKDLQGIISNSRTMKECYLDCLSYLCNIFPDCLDNAQTNFEYDHDKAERIRFSEFEELIEYSGRSIHTRRVPGTKYYAATNFKHFDLCENFKQVIRSCGIDMEIFYLFSANPKKNP